MTKMKQILNFIIAGLLFSLSLSGHAAENPIVKIQTNLGDIYVELFPDKAPRTVANFLQYVEDDFYTNTIFHRVMRDFMIQGGGFTPTFERKETRPPIINEADNGLSNVRSTIAMARTFEPQSATAQFYINVVDNSFKLDHKNNTPRGYGYAVFGKVTKGMDVVDAIRDIPTGPGGPFQANVPKSAAIILGMTYINKPKITTTTDKPVVQGK
jgi:cyclophilin family peptidyl-prolyl cis-trans isomerase